MNTFGENIKITIFGEGMSPAIGVVLDGLPAGEEIDINSIREQLRHRAPGFSVLGAPRNQTDEPIILSGVFEGRSTGAPICLTVRNPEKESLPQDPYRIRPSHADLTSQIKFRGYADYRGNGPFSGRLMTAIVLAGTLCRLVLTRREISVRARIIRVGAHSGDDLSFDMKKEILHVRAAGDSVGSVIECVAEGVPAGLGGLMFGGMESRIASILYVIPGVRALEFGDGFSLATMRGSEANDPVQIKDGRIYTETNRSGGLNGGITNGMPLVLRVALRPSPSIMKEQKTIDLENMKNTTIRIDGRHEPCLAPLALPVVEAALAFCLLDAIYDH